MNKATKIEAAKMIRWVAEEASQSMDYLYNELAHIGYTGDDAEDILDTANITATLVDVEGRFVALAVCV